MNLDKLSSSLRYKVENRPTLTILKSSSIQATNLYNTSPKDYPELSISLPTNFDGKEVWKSFITKPKNQGSCGSCWSFASTSCLADRFNIHTYGKIKVNLSPAGMLICDLLGNEETVSDFRPEHNVQLTNSINAESLRKAGCTGNTLIDSWRYLFVIGAVTIECVPDDLRPQDIPLSKYTSPENIPLCSEVMGLYGDLCINRHWDARTGNLIGTPARFFRSINYYHIPGTEKEGASEENIRTEIFRFGPVTTGYKVYADFYNFDPKTEIYEYDEVSPQVGGHAVILIGWGEEIKNNILTKFWWIKNSWGEDWGIGGYFKMIRGVNNCELEENVVAGLPDLFYNDIFDLSSINYLSQGIPESILNERKRRDTGFSVESGGIDQTLGFTRRTLIRFPGYDFSPLLNSNEYPDYNTFIAGEMMIEGFTLKSNSILPLILLFAFTIVLLILFLVIITKKK